MQNRQSLSHRTTNYRLFLQELSEHYGDSFTDTEMLQKLPINSLNTIRKIRIDLQRKGVIKLHEHNLPNNQKRYKISDKRQFIKTLREYTVLNEWKTRSHSFSDESATYFKKFGPLILVKYPKKLKFRTDHKYPIKLYKRKICPVCQGKLHDFKSGKFNLNDYKCSKCKFTFYYGASILASEKPIKNKKSLNFDPWHSYYNPVRQQAVNKIQGKILREMGYGKSDN